MINKTKFVIGTGAILTMALAMLVSVPAAEAYEVNITAGSDLTIGSTGQSVVVLQGLLAERGFLDIPYYIPLGYYGSMTKNAVAKYQAYRNVAPAVGYFGSLTKVSMHQEFLANNWLVKLGW
jgi:peptidoglycan hydrolase-like protein with peptidoglycan-binding domain